MVIRVKWSKEEVEALLAKLYYISTKICKYDYTKNKWNSPLFEDLVWIIAKVNYEMCNKYCLPCIDVSMFNFYEDQYNFTPDEFNKKGLDWLDLVSVAEEECIDSVCFRWKLYGKYIVRFKSFLNKIRIFVMSIKMKGHK